MSDERRTFDCRLPIQFGELDADGDLFEKGCKMTVYGFPVRQMTTEDEAKLLAEGEMVIRFRRSR